VRRRLREEKHSFVLAVRARVPLHILVLVLVLVLWVGAETGRVAVCAFLLRPRLERERCGLQGLHGGTYGNGRDKEREEKRWQRRRGQR
jgi:hypothetical protein